MVKTPPLVSHVVPPSVVYSYEPAPPVAVIVIVPSSTPQSVGSLLVTLTIDGAFGAVKTTGLFTSNVKQVPSIFLTATLYVPAARLVKLADKDQFSPPSIEYSIIPTPEAVIVIVPSSTPQLFGLADVTFVMVGCTGSVKITSASVTVHVPSAFLTRIGYVPPAKLVNKPPGCQVAPPSIENCNEAPFGELALILIPPSAKPQLLGSVGVTFTITGATLSVKVTI